MKLPKIDSLVPSKNSDIQDKQTFSARVRPSPATKADISQVSFQIEDEEGQKSGWLSVPKVGDYHEITVEGFAEYPGSKWIYMMRAVDQEGKQKISTVKVAVATRVSIAYTPPAPSPPAQAPPAPSSPTSPLPRTRVEDSDWPHAGAIRSATGRIMFEFDGSDESFVCSGTVVMDGRDGRTPDGANGRTIIQTAAHCAYNDVLKKFARRAVFIPDQASTRGNKSNFDCWDDLYGCWYLSFAVVAKGWAEGSFPHNVPFDYAYYTVFDDGSTHRGGYGQGLTGILDRDVTPAALDFDADPRGEFVFSIGYSADKDPSLRHCSMANTDIYGLSWYANLWLDDCAMTGGASGGPWMVDMDDGGVGTLISVNSWGFADRIGMAGPVLRTKDGSWAECLYDKAKSASDPGDVGGIIVNRC